MVEGIYSQGKEEGTEAQRTPKCCLPSQVPGSARLQGFEGVSLGLERPGPTDSAPQGQEGTPRCESDLRSRPPGQLGVGWGRFERTLQSVENIPSRWNHNAQARVGSCVWNVLSRSLQAQEAGLSRAQVQLPLWANGVTKLEYLRAGGSLSPGP